MLGWGTGLPLNGSVWSFQTLIKEYFGEGFKLYFLRVCVCVSGGVRAGNV